MVEPFCAFTTSSIYCITFFLGVRSLGGTFSVSVLDWKNGYGKGDTEVYRHENQSEDHCGEGFLENWR